MTAEKKPSKYSLLMPPGLIESLEAQARKSKLSTAALIGLYYRTAMDMHIELERIIDESGLPIDYIFPQLLLQAVRSYKEKSNSKK